MANLGWKLGVIGLLFAGEALSVYAEMLAAKSYSLAGSSYWPIFIKAFGAITLAGGLLIAGYMLGYKSFKNIWIVSALSITSILIMEPLVAYLVFKTLPTRGALIGLVMGALGFLATFTL